MLTGLLFSLGGSAAGQTPETTDPLSAQFLEKRVHDELASEGTVLSSHNLGLNIELVADRWLVSLVELTTNRVAASTRIDHLPTDREAAVAVMTDVVADLEAQLLDREGKPARAARPSVAQPPSTDARAESALREATDLELNRRSLRFRASYDPCTYPGTSNGRWLVYPDKCMDRSLLGTAVNVD